MNQEECSSRIIETVIESAQGMFLLAHLHMEELVREITTNGLQHKLNNLPRTTDKIYEAALTRIKAQEARKRELAIDLLSYILNAARPLTVHELSHVFATQNGSRKLEDIHGDILADGYLTSTCAGIVMYFQDHMGNDQVFHKGSSSLAEKCLIYLSFAEFSQVLSADEVQHRMVQYPFLNYAADNWHIHLAETPDGDLDHIALKFLECTSKVSSAVQAMSDSRTSSEKRVTGLHLATYLNAVSSVNLLLSKSNGIDAKTQYGETAMHWAIDYDRVDILKALTQKGADINATDKNGRTVLHRAAACGKVNLAKILVKAKHINLNALDFQNYTPLGTAPHHGNGSMVRLLVEHGADLDIRDEQGWAALRDAALREHHLIVKYLIKQGAKCEVQATKGHYWSVLCWAATQGHISVVRLLVEKGANLNVTTDEGKSALRCAMEYGYGKVAWLLVKAGRNIDLNIPDHDGWSPLHAAVKRSLVSDASFLWLLLENGANVSAQTKRGLTALHIAAEEDDIPIAWVLLEKGVKINVKNKGGMTALHIASRRGNDKFVRFLLEMGADPIAVDASDKTALHWTINELVEGSTDHHKVTKRLIEWMANTAI
ncbi:ankyrin repeat-containing domain protein [Ilyonectria sp. MPI-CAGE-AT-0026]|nr:ankyrin repeat-containing domain protein [Ilyonectria sp. MPI-CAGE-AT-0026]